MKKLAASLLLLTLCACGKKAEDTSGAEDTGTMSPPPRDTSTTGIDVSPPPPPPSPDSARAAPERTVDSVSRVVVYYGTDRRAEAGLATRYGSRRGTLEYGQVEVTIPPDHHPGQLESPDWKHLTFHFDPKKHVVLDKIEPLAEANMFARLSKDVAGTKSHELFVFVHGFNVTFQDAARRTAQIAFDLNLQAVPVMYSWPSQGQTSQYVADAQVIDYTIPDLATFLEKVAAKSGATKVHLLAHSMGTLALTKAVARISAQPTHPSFQNIILAAPDIDIDVFRRDIEPALASAAKRLTIYASANDEALRASRKINRVARLGQAGPTLFVMNGVETIDATRIQGDWLGHSYFAGNKEVLDDLYGAILLDRPASARNLRVRSKNALPYWALP